jgi:uncharacterized membrane protein
MNIEKILSIDKKILKTITYRLLGSLLTVLISLFLGVPFEWASIIGLSELIIKPILYFFHEYLWDNLKTKKPTSSYVDKILITDQVMKSDSSEIKRISYKSNR